MKKYLFLLLIIPYFSFSQTESVIKEWTYTLQNFTKEMEKKGKVIIEEGVSLYKDFISIIKSYSKEINSLNKDNKDNITYSPQQNIMYVFYANGTIKREINIKKNSWVTYYKNGNKKEEGSWRETEGLQYGLWLYYDINEKLIKKGYWKNNKQDGRWDYYDNNGSLTQKAFWKNGKKDGLSESYDASGKTISKIIFNNGIPACKKDCYYLVSDTDCWSSHLTFQSQDKNVVFCLSRVFSDSNKGVNGILFEQYANGNIKYEIEYKKGKYKGGWVKYYNEAGALKCKIKYKKKSWLRSKPKVVYRPK